MPKLKTTDNATIHYETHGSGVVNLIFLHGLGGGVSELWDGVVECLDLKQFRALCPDFRGQGKSSRPASGYTWDAFSRDILAVADHADARSFIPVGFSFGGKLGCYMPSRHPNRILAQVLFAPVETRNNSTQTRIGNSTLPGCGGLAPHKSIFQKYVVRAGPKPRTGGQLLQIGRGDSNLRFGSIR